MRKLAVVLACLGAPAFAGGLQIELAGEEANGTIVIDLFEDVAPNHAARLKELAAAGAYDNVVFHRVINGFMAQTGDVRFGKLGSDMRRAGQGGSDLPDLKQEFSDIPYDEAGIVGIARSSEVDSANSQFFIMFGPYPSLTGQYTVVGKVTEGQDVVDAIKRGRGQGGVVLGQPDYMKKVTVIE